MDEPDFARYSEDQLRQVLGRIDAGRFPERVQKIRARLAELEVERASGIAADESEPDSGPPEIAGFWRRLGAFVIDSLLLGLVGYGLGKLLHEEFETMGPWGRLVGFAVALAYFGAMESRLFEGKTFGKLSMDIKVAAINGTPLNVGQALLRSTVFFIPYFLNNVALGDGNSTVLAAVQAVLVFGLGGAIVYLYLFNRRTRQSIHDLLVGAIVVRAKPAEPPFLRPLWNGHLATIAVLLLLGTGTAAYGFSKVDDTTLHSLKSLQQKLSQLPAVRHASVVEGTSFATGGERTTSLTITALSSLKSADEKSALVRSIAAIALTAYPAARQLDVVSVSLVRGYDIGIASDWNVMTFNAPPGGWQEALAGKN